MAVPVRGSLGSRLRREALMSVASGESQVLDIVTLAASREPALREIKLKDLLLARPGATPKTVSDQVKWLSLQLGVSAGSQPLRWFLNPFAPLRLTLLRSVVLRGCPPPVGTVEGGCASWR